jgi:pimeloyl-ACP methyl ester carboxylesterase
VPVDAVEVPLPSWQDLRQAGASLDDLTADDLEEFGRRAVPHPAQVAREPVSLHNPARRTVPTTVIACSISADAVRELAAEGHPVFSEVAQLDDLTLLDLPTGHWPMLSKPVELARILDELARR